MMTINTPFTLTPNCLKGKVVLLTGCTGGLGQEVALNLAQHGAEVILVGRRLKELERLYDAITEHGYTEPAIHVTQLLSMGVEEAASLHDHIAQLFGRLDGLIHCAGAIGTLTPLEHYSESTWLEIMHLNLNVPFLLTKALLPLLKKAPKGTVLFTQSDLATEAKANWGAYNCAQMGLHAMMQMWQQEHDYQNLSFTSVNPGPMKTALRSKLYPGEPGGCDPKLIAPFYSALLGDWGQAFKGTLCNLQKHMDT